MANITDKIQQIRQAVFGKDVRESIATGIEAINTEVENTTGRQTTLETIMNNLADELNESEDTRVLNEDSRINAEADRQLAEQNRVTEFQEIVNIYETANHDNVNIELVQARNGEVNLDTRLDKIDNKIGDLSTLGVGSTVEKFNQVDSQLAERSTYQINQSQQINDVKFIAHRGASQVAPENSIPAYQIAGKSGFWGAECDILPTSDGVWVLMHDDSVARTTNGIGNVVDLTLSQIKAFNMDIGSNIGLYPNLKVPTLEEYLITCKKYNIVPMIEIKGVTSSTNFDNLIALIKKYQFETKLIIISAYPETLVEIRNRSNLIYLMYVTNAIYATSIADTLALGNSGMDIDYTIATQTLIDQIHATGMKVSVWTVNDFSIAKTMIERGVDFIASDNIVNVRWE